MKYYLVPEEGNPQNFVMIGSTQVRSGILIPDNLKHENAADLIITRTTDEEGAELVTVTLDEKAKSERVTREQQERQAEEQKLSAAKAQRQQEINKLKSGQLTLEQKVEVLWRLYLSDQGELELEAPPPGGGKEGKL